MVELRDLYKCQVCGNLVEVVYAGGGTLVCCNEPMKKMEAKTEEKEVSKEKHVPVVAETSAGISVQVGSVEHPMEEKHYIKFIEVLTAEKVCRAELQPGQKPAADFPVKIKDVLEVREYCNLHGVWKHK